MQKQRQLFWKRGDLFKDDHNQLAASKSTLNSINQSTGQARTYIFPQEQTRSIKHLKNLQEPYQAFHNHANIATTILKWQHSSTTGQNHQPASKS